MWGRALCRTTKPFVSIPRRFFGSTSEAYSAFHNKPLPLLWSLVPWIVNKIPLRSQNTYVTAGGSGDYSVHVSSVITPTLRSENVCGGRRSAITNITCYYWACALALWQRVSFYQPIGGWFWNCPRGFVVQIGVFDTLQSLTRQNWSVVAHRANLDIYNGVVLQ